MNTLRKAFALLSREERRQSLLLVLVLVVMALFDVMGTASIMPFLAVLADPELIARTEALRWLDATLGFESRDGFLYFLGGLSFTLLIVAAVVRTLGLYTLNRFTQMRSHSIALRLFETYLRQPYSFFLNHHTGDMAKGLLSEVNQLVAQVFQPVAHMIAQGIMLLAMLSLLVAIDPVVALVLMIGLALTYWLIYMTVRRYLTHAGQARVAANKGRFKTVAEALGGIKTLKLMGQEAGYRDQFAEYSRRFAHYQSVSNTVAQVPKYTVEAIAFGGIIVLTLTLMARHADGSGAVLGKVLPLLGLYAFAGYRMLPAVQALYSAATQLRFSAAIVDTIHADLAIRDRLDPLATRPATPLPFHARVELEGLSFRYSGSTGAGVTGVSLGIPAGSTLGIVGSTGAGKTTLVDLILGLLLPDSGVIRVDDTPVTRENLRAWQADLGYVPQDIFLIDASVAQNIAFGVPAAQIDMDRVRDCARMAQIRTFIETDLPRGFDTTVGERGIRLSGGQRQRLGIARALYHDPGIIIFDEATSALDNLTEQEVMRAVTALSGLKTVIMIAHRISTVRNCDQIAVLDKGHLVGLGGYDDLYRNNAAFRRLVTTADAA
jgi:ATP-binding cassette, subfamily B, bacterial PglK